MQTRFLCALIAMTVAGTAVAQAVQPSPPDVGTPPARFAGGLPPPPPGCVGNGALPLPSPPPRPWPPVPASDDGFAKDLGINSTQATKVQQVFERQAAQAQRLDQQRRDMDAETCRSLQSIIGDQGMARWSAAFPPPPPPGGPWRGPHLMPPPPPPPQGQ